MPNDQIPFNFEKRQQKKPPKPKELPKPEPPPRQSAFRRCWGYLYRSALVPLAGFALSCVPQTFRGVVSAVLVPVIVATLGVHLYPTPPSHRSPPTKEIPAPELPKAEPPKKDSRQDEPKIAPSNPEQTPDGKNPWEAIVRQG